MRQVHNEELLNFALENGMLDLSQIQCEIEMAKRVKYLKEHQHKVWQGKDGKWCTYLPDAKKGRKFIKKNTREDIEDCIVSFYKKLDESDCRTFGDVYEEWRAYQDKTVSDNTVSKYDTDKERYFTGTEFWDTDISAITEDDVKEFVIDSVKSKGLCKSATKGIFGYIDRTLTFAARHKYIPEVPTQYLSGKDFYQYSADSPRADVSPIISKEDYLLLENALRHDHIEHPGYIPSYAVEFASLTGMRVGEIAALRWDCIFDDHILIDKSEKYNSKTKKYFIDKTKNKKIRKFPLTQEIKELLTSIKKAELEAGYLSEWVFSDETGRISYRKICSCVKNKCRQLGITTRGIHAYRKTLNSNMRCNGVSPVVAASILGHSAQVNEQYYTFDVSSMDDKLRIVSMANEAMKKAE